MLFVLSTFVLFNAFFRLKPQNKQNKVRVENKIKNLFLIKKKYFIKMLVVSNVRAAKGV